VLDTKVAPFPFSLISVVYVVSMPIHFSFPLSHTSSVHHHKSEGSMLTYLCKSCINTEPLINIGLVLCVDLQNTCPKLPFTPGHNLAAAPQKTNCSDMFSPPISPTPPTQRNKIGLTDVNYFSHINIYTYIHLQTNTHTHTPGQCLAVAHPTPEQPWLR
jgi:hypothetical protein